MYAVKLMFMSGLHDGLEVWLKSNEGKGHAILDGWEFTLGRGEECDLFVPFDTQASRQHAFMRIYETRLELADADSRNGTFINDRRISKSALLKVNDMFRIGHTTFRLQDFTT